MVALVLMLHRNRGLLLGLHGVEVCIYRSRQQLDLLVLVFHKCVQIVECFFCQ